MLGGHMFSMLIWEERVTEKGGKTEGEKGGEKKTKSAFSFGHTEFKLTAR